MTACTVARSARCIANIAGSSTGGTVNQCTVGVDIAMAVSTGIAVDIRDNSGCIRTAVTGSTGCLARYAGMILDLMAIGAVKVT